MITEKYNLNQSTFDFLLEYTKLIKSGVVLVIRNLWIYSKRLSFFRKEVETYYPTAISKLIWYTIHRQRKIGENMSPLRAFYFFSF